jgi:hypothetical protein
MTPSSLLEIYGNSGVTYCCVLDLPFDHEYADSIFAPFLQIKSHEYCGIASSCISQNNSDYISTNLYLNMLLLKY